MLELKVRNRLSTYLLDRLPGQMYDVYYSSLEKYCDTYIYGLLNEAYNNLFLAYTTSHGVTSWEFFYTTKPADMPHTEWIQLLYIVNIIAREGPTEYNINRLIQFFDPTGTIFLVPEYAILDDPSRFAVPADSPREYILLSEDSLFSLTEKEKEELYLEELRVFENRYIWYQTSELDIPKRSYKILLRELLDLLLPANVEVLLKFKKNVCLYSAPMWGDLAHSDQLQTVAHFDNLNTWYYITLPYPIYALVPTRDETVYAICRIPERSYVYAVFKIVGTTYEKIGEIETTDYILNLVSKAFNNKVILWASYNKLFAFDVSTKASQILEYPAIANVSSSISESNFAVCYAEYTGTSLQYLLKVEVYNKNLEKVQEVVLDNFYTAAYFKTHFRAESFRILNSVQGVESFADGTTSYTYVHSLEDGSVISQISYSGAFITGEVKDARSYVVLVQESGNYIIKSINLLENTIETIATIPHPGHIYIIEDDVFIITLNTATIIHNYLDAVNRTVEEVTLTNPYSVNSLFKPVSNIKVLP